MIIRASQKDKQTTRFTRRRWKINQLRADLLTHIRDGCEQRGAATRFQREVKGPGGIQIQSPENEEVGVKERADAVKRIARHLESPGACT